MGAPSQLLLKIRQIRMKQTSLVVIITLPLLLYLRYFFNNNPNRFVYAVTNKVIIIFFFDVSGDNENCRNLISHDFSIDNFLRFMSCLPDTYFLLISNRLQLPFSTIK